MSVDKIAILPVAQRTEIGVEPRVSGALRMALENVESGEIVSVGVMTASPTPRASRTWQCSSKNGHAPAATSHDFESERILNTAHYERRV